MYPNVGVGENGRDKEGDFSLRVLKIKTHKHKESYFSFHTHCANCAKVQSIGEACHMKHQLRLRISVKKETKECTGQSHVDFFKKNPKPNFPNF